MSGRPADLQPHHRLEVITGGGAWMRAEAFVYDIYRSIGFCKESRRRRVEELARWADDSTIHAVIDDGDQIVGTIRTIFGNYDDLPVGQFDRTDRSHPDPVCELSSLVVRDADRGTGVIEHLYRAGWLDGFRSGSSAIVGLIDPWLYDAFRDYYGLPFTIIGDARPYMGTVPVPVGMPLAGEAYLPLSRDNPDFWEWTLEAINPPEIAAWGLPIVLPRKEPVSRPTRAHR